MAATCTFTSASVAVPRPAPLRCVTSVLAAIHPAGQGRVRPCNYQCPRRSAAGPRMSAPPCNSEHADEIAASAHRRPLWSEPCRVGGRLSSGEFDLCRYLGEQDNFRRGRHAGGCRGLLGVSGQLHLHQAKLHRLLLGIDGGRVRPDEFGLQRYRVQRHMQYLH
ncbi:hypothetical protein SUTH_01868 [Sulfuritalea hydrogenivorans sk43H]|uniref:Uncharacterized protein n=1 Tax=Sulfuritalea hydrogenivorans sk43H TaxID=1223802 RepID=W0SFV3_9PROT|nr:hypothetical protein SUTH_01868 [Sulfuritalea hydrogenivorans sk43H]